MPRSFVNAKRYSALSTQHSALSTQHYNVAPMAQPEPNKIIYSMVGVSKFHGKKQVLKDIYLSYFYGAKIGVIGLNGSGKSSLLRILAGEDNDFLGETVLSPGYTVGFLQQEPHLDAESVEWLEKHLQQYRGTVIAVTHDRYFLDNVAGWILELDRGAGIPFKGNYSSWLEQKQERLKNEEKSESQRQKTLERELEWIRMSPKGRHAKGKARINQYESLLNQEAQEKIQDLEIYVPPGPRLGNVVVEADQVRKAYGENLLIEDMSFNLPPGGIIGVIGPNGAGKTTLFRMMIGQEKPDGGTIRLGETVKLAYVDQSRTLDPDKSIFEEITGGGDVVQLGPREMSSRAYVARFNFSGQDQQKKVGALSGGERNRVHLAKMLKEGANVLLLDEPTNDLDVNTMRALEEALENFAGCAIVISHDRWFLDRVATHILAFEGDSRVAWFEGNFSDYEEDKRARLGDAATQPHRIKYRQLTRG